MNVETTKTGDMRMSLRRAKCALFLVVLLSAGLVNSVLQSAEPTKSVLIVVGPSSHPPGTHEVAAGARVMEHCLGQVDGVQVTLHQGWPQNSKLVKNAATIVFIGDLFPPEVLPEPEKVKAELAAAMDRGCGLVCVHYATGLRAQHVAQDGSHPLLKWLGGYFASGCPHHKSVARVCPATLTPEKVDHPVLRGWKEFQFDDEPYWNNYFGKDGPPQNVTSLVSTLLPARSPEERNRGLGRGASRWRTRCRAGHTPLLSQLADRRSPHADPQLDLLDSQVRNPTRRCAVVTAGSGQV